MDNAFHANEGQAWKTLSLTRVYCLTCMAHNHKPTNETLILTLILSYCHNSIQNQSNVELNFFKSGGLMPSAQKMSRSRNFEFRQILLACFSMGNMNANHSPTVHGFPSLAFVGMKCNIPY